MGSVMRRDQEAVDISCLVLEAVRRNRGRGAATDLAKNMVIAISAILAREIGTAETIGLLDDAITVLQLGAQSTG